MALSPEQTQILLYYLKQAQSSQTPYLALNEAEQIVFATLLAHPALDKALLASVLPPGVVLANLKRLQEQHPNYNSYNGYPLYYRDMPFSCCDCGQAQIWSAAQQKWWYEEAGGSLHATAIRCRPCRQNKA